MYIENVKSQMRKGMLEYSIMLLLRDRPFYTSDIIDALEKANLIVVEGTLYPLLSRLRKEGILDYEWQESSQGPPRKYYKLFYLQKKQKKLRNPEQGFRNNDILLYYWLFSCRSSSETARRNSSS